MRNVPFSRSSFIVGKTEVPFEGPFGSCQRYHVPRSKHNWLAKVMKSNKMLPCKCGHPKSFHARVYVRVMPRNSTTECNFPGCKCGSYRLKEAVREQRES